jgi:hypothetical protein
MSNTIAAVMRHARNYFERARIEGSISVSGGMVSPVPAAPYVCISGSLYHDGVHKVEAGAFADNAAPDETFTGTVWLLHPPADFLLMCEEIATYCEKNPAGALHSESLGEYSYTRASGNNGVLTWQQAFANQLRPYMHMFTEVG